MEKSLPLAWILVLISTTSTMAPARCRAYYSNAVQYVPAPQKVTHLHFFLRDTLTGKAPTSVPVARPNMTIAAPSNGPLPLDTVLAVNDPITIGPNITSEVIGNAQGLSVSTGQDVPVLVVYLDLGFTKGEFNGSSIGLFSRNHVLEPKRELAVVGGTGKFRMAKGFAQLKTYYNANITTGDVIVEYNVTVIHY